MIDLVATLRRGSEETIEIRLSERLATTIARIDARDRGSLNAAGSQPALEACATSVCVDRMTAQRWSDQAWRAVGEGLLAPAEAQALSDQLAPRGAP